ncbi:MAG: hypothetical protein KJ017_05415 [Alphaproteobacteria bacterium]|nr:hypothetical protein [Alphaproteobacteria bacterium]
MTPSKSKTAKIIAVLLVVFLCAVSFVGGAFFGKKYGHDFSFKQGYATGYLDLAENIKSATEGNPETENKDCSPISAMKWVSISVCTTNGSKTIKVD